MHRVGRRIQCSESRLEYFSNQYGRSVVMRLNKKLKCQESRVHIQGRDGLFSGGGPCSRAVWAQAGPAAGGLLAAVLLPGWESFGGAPGWGVDYWVEAGGPASTQGNEGLVCSNN